MMLSDVCLSRTSGLSREQRGIGRLKLAQRYYTSHLTRTPVLRSKDQRSRSPGRFTHRGVNASAAAAVSVRTYWPWKPSATLRSALCMRGGLGGARRFGAYRGRRAAGAYCGGRLFLHVRQAPPMTLCFHRRLLTGLLKYCCMD